jgi:TolB-like protein
LTRIASWRQKGLLLAALALTLVLAAITWPLLRGSRPPASVPGAIQSIAVLPLANLSGNPSQEYFTDGMTDQLIGTLGRLSGVSVISYTSVMQFKGAKKPLPEIVTALNVDAVLEGSVLLVPGNSQAQSASPSRVRINARLIQAGTGTQLWDRTFEAVVGDVLALQSEVARAVADGIGLRLTAQRQPRGQTGQDFNTFDLYLRGRYYWNMRTPEGLQRSIQYFREAIDRDPGYALGYAGLADAYNLLAGYGLAPRDEALRQGSAAATRALELDDELAEAHASLAFIHDERREWNAADAGF